MYKYEKHFKIPYYDTDQNGRVHPYSLLTYMGETSSCHSDSLGIGIDELRKNNYGWMLNRWKVEFYNFPKVKDMINIKTWTSSFDKFYATREFCIYDNKGGEVVRATTQWIFLDIIRKRPIRIPESLHKKYNILDEKLLHSYYEFANLPNIENKIDFYVRKSDIDYNNHVNNVKYLNWILEAVPVEIDNKYMLYELDIQYKKEIKLGDSIISEIDKGRPNGTGIEYLHMIRVADSKDISCFGRTRWRKK